MSSKRKNEADDSENEELGDQSSPGDCEATASCFGNNSEDNIVEMNGRQGSVDIEKHATAIEVLLENKESQKLEEFPCQIPGCMQFFNTLLDYDTHYNMKHKYTCATCKKTLLSPHFLELHVLESHDTLFELMAQRRPMFQCYVEDCKEKFTTAKDRHNHGVTTHGYPKNFMYSQNPNKVLWQKPKGNKGKQKPQSSRSTTTQSTSTTASRSSSENTHMDIEGDISETKPNKRSDNVKLAKEKTPHMHISFGHKTTKVFSRKTKFGMKPERNNQPATSVTGMDLDELKNALEETEKVDNEKVLLAS